MPRLDATRALAEASATALRVPAARFRRSLWPTSRRGKTTRRRCRRLHRLIDEYECGRRSGWSRWPSEQIERPRRTSSSWTRCSWGWPASCGWCCSALATRPPAQRQLSLPTGSRSSTAGWPGSSTSRLATFERKPYASLSHEANKAMNLNAYIGLMGGTLRRGVHPGRHRAACRCRRREAGDLIVPDTEYLLTLDADSHPAARLLPAAGVPPGTARQRARRRHPDAVLRRSAAPPPASSGSPARPPTCSTSCTRA